MIQYPHWVGDLSGSQMWSIVLQLVWRLAVLEARKLRIRITLCWLESLRALGFQ
jgi:hypothetical protein